MCNEHNGTSEVSTGDFVAELGDSIGELAKCLPGGATVFGPPHDQVLALLDRRKYTCADLELRKSRFHYRFDV
jgi:hypothetical protein